MFWRWRSYQPPAQFQMVSSPNSAKIPFEMEGIFQQPVSLNVWSPCAKSPFLSVTTGELPSGYDQRSHGFDGPFIDGLQFLKMVIFHGKLLNNQMVLLVGCHQYENRRPAACEKQLLILCAGHHRPSKIWLWMAVMCIIRSTETSMFYHCTLNEHVVISRTLLLLSYSHTHVYIIIYICFYI